ncbi:MAG: hypothetical protein U0354_17825 [Candidatus Sericytochromatia bacterium]
MSIGFITSGTSSRTVDIYSGGGNRSVDLALQNVLNRYDKVKTDLDRLVDQAQKGTYDITSRQHYNSYNKESVNGWSENWYAEYRAVLALRADALQKKLQSSYNRVLERSAYADMNPDRQSVFAPYSNRTFKDDVNNTDILNNKMRIANVMMVDTELTSTATPNPIPPGYTPLWNTTAIQNYLSNVDGTGFPPGRVGLTSYTTYAANSVYHSYSEYTSAIAVPTPSGSDMPDWRWTDGNTPAISLPYSSSNPPNKGLDNPGSHGYASSNVTKRQAQRDKALQAINDALATWPPAPTTEPELSEYNANKDDAVEAGLQVMDNLWKGSIDTKDIDDGSNPLNPHDDNDLIPDDYRDFLNEANPQIIYQPVFDTVVNFKPGQTSTAPSPTPPTIPAPVPGDYPAIESLMQAYANPNSIIAGSGTFDPSKYQGLDGTGFRVKVPEFGMGELYNLITNVLPPDVKDTIDATTLDGLTPAINQIVQSFVGMQYNNIYKGNYYDAKPMASSIGIYGYLVKSANPFSVMANADENYPGGSIIQAGSTGFLPGIPEDNPKSQVIIPLTPLPLSIDIGFKGTIGPDLYYGQASAISNLSSRGLVAGSEVLGSVRLPTIGLGSASVAIGIGGPSGSPQAGVIINVGFSYDILAQAFKEILTRLKAFLVEAMTVNSYATSSGVAMDSYAARAEYHFTQPGFLEAVKALNFDIPVLGIPIPFPLGDLMETFMTSGLPSPVSVLTSILGLGMLDNNDDQDTYVNDQRLRERLFDYKHAVQGAESRETETGAFFATNAFLGQFEMSDMSSEYWIGTQQNEEIVNMDLARAFTTAGPEIIKTLLATASTVSNKSNSTWLTGALKAVFNGQKDKELLNIMYDLMYRDQLGKGGAKGDIGNAVGQLDIVSGFVGGSGTMGGTRIAMQKSSFTSEAYDYIENDHKPYEGDSDFNYKSGGILSGIPIVGGIFQALFEANTPDFILEGMANTRRFTKSDWDDNITLAAVTNAYNNQDAETGLGPRGKLGRGYLQYNNRQIPSMINPYPDGDTSKGWDDTDFNLGDINEVYTATRKVKFNNLTFGFGEFDQGDLTEDQITGTNPVANINSDLGATRQTAARVKRYVGSDSRITERRYDGASAVNHETFTAGTYSRGDNKKYYDRRNSYSLAFKTTADGNQYNLFGSQALNPTMGGFLKMSTIDKNKTDEALIEHNRGGMTALKAKLSGMGAATRKDVQNFGGTVEGDLNEVNTLLYEHLHVRSDGRNLSTVKEYRDVFETGLMSSIFLSGQTYHQSGGGITSSIEIRYDPTQGKSSLQTDTRENFNQSNVNFDPYNTPFLTRSRGQATTYLNSYFAYKKRSTNNKT